MARAVLLHDITIRDAVSRHISDRRAFLAAVMRETAKMGFPARMAGGTGPIRGKVKQRVIEFFAGPVADIFTDAPPSNTEYPRWHHALCDRFASGLVDGTIGDGIANGKERFALGAKFVDTFMHQLIKYPEYRYLYDALYLPLDRAVIPHLRRAFRRHGMRPTGGNLDQCLREDKVYALTMDDYDFVQSELARLAVATGSQIGRKGMARIELNVLWA